MRRVEIKKWLADSGTITTKKSRSSYVSRVFGAESLLRQRGFADVAAFDRLPAPDEEPDGLEGIVREIKSLIALPERPRAKGTLQDYVSAIRHGVRRWITLDHRDPLDT